MEREKSKTAGRRMNTLVGDALDQDEQFWDHSTWKEKDDEISDADGSYDVADEAKEDVVDRFDSDFNDSESSEDENDGEGAIEDDLRNVKRKSVYSDPTATRKLKSGSKMYKKDKRGVRRHVMAGEGINAGLVLGMPGKNKPIVTTNVSAKISQNSVPNSNGSSSLADLKSTRSIRKSQRIQQVMIPSRRSRRANTVVKSEAAQTNQKIKEKASLERRGTAKPKRQRKKYTQEKLLVEAATKTEPQNEMWLLNRRRDQAMAETEAGNALASKTAMSFRARFHSRRGCLNTLTFPSVDLMPKILKGQKKEARQKKRKKEVCVITGKLGRYRDPKTGMCYHDSVAFKELRRRHDAKEPLSTNVSNEPQKIPKVIEIKQGKVNGIDASRELSLSSIQKAKVGPVGEQTAGNLPPSSSTKKLAAGSPQPLPTISNGSVVSNKGHSQVTYSSQMNDSYRVLSMHGIHPAMMMNSNIPNQLSLNLAMPPPKNIKPPTSSCVASSVKSTHSATL